MATREPRLRIGELSRRIGTTADVLRSWERRYRVLEPERSDNGYRVYSLRDVRRAASMQAHVSRGVAPAEAAALVLAADHEDPAIELLNTSAADLLANLRRAVEEYDAPTAEQVISRSVLNLGLAGAIQHVLLPHLRDVGDCWANAELTVAQEHFATGIVRRRLLEVAGDWSAGSRSALLACAPGEQHDVGLLCFGLALHSYHGWRITYLGPDTPILDLARAARSLNPDLVVTSSVSTARFFQGLAYWRQVAAEFRLAIGGAGAGARLARRMGASFLSGDPVSAAARVVAA